MEAGRERQAAAGCLTFHRVLQMSWGGFIWGFYCWGWEFLTALLLFSGIKGELLEEEGVRRKGPGLVLEMSAAAQKLQPPPGKSGGGGGNSGGPAPFLVKTHQMVEDAGTDEVISWNEEGSSFVVWKPVEFARDLLPAHFKHNNFSSFVRQLNTYGFRKVVPDRWEFANDHFRRGEQRLLSEIRRRKASSPQQILSATGTRIAGHHSSAVGALNNKDDDQSSTSTSSLSPSQHDPKQLSEENEKLRKDNQTLSSELARARRHCEELLAFLSKYVDVDKLEPALVKTAGNASAASTGRQEGVAEVAMEGTEQREGKGEGEESNLRLFGVWVKKRGRCEEGGDGGGRTAKKAMMGFGPSLWMEAISSSPVQGASRV
ncbi:hypothetical protein Taro_026136 [Colocasia esculenta]|uniref:HSF-type DNA-binding domain-containing protein n=1 Tax=Colocasia esculenta TaxID=4460 RepID=A0A843VJQ2_COLES|nr:hypothetical protein [Colocasia esculenta]